MNDIIRPCAELLCMSVFSATSSFAWAQAAFDRALRNGAEARVVVSVVDDDGRPDPGGPAYGNLLVSRLPLAAVEHLRENGAPIDSEHLR